MNCMQGGECLNWDVNRSRINPARRIGGWQKCPKDIE